MKSNDDELSSPLEFLKEKSEHAGHELETDSPLLALSFPGGIYMVSFSNSAVHKKIAVLAKHDGVKILFGGRGNQTDLAYLRKKLKSRIEAYELNINGADLAGRLVSKDAETIIRRHYLSEDKITALAVQIVIADPYDPRYPFCAIDFTGKAEVGRNFVLEGKDEVTLIEEKFDSLEKVEFWAKKILDKSVRDKHQRRFFYNEVFLFSN